jgi:hypothetical protein
VPLAFVRQVLSIGMRNGSIIDNKGQYQAVFEKLNVYNVDMNEFEASWKKLIGSFKSFCLFYKYSVNGLTIENDIFEFLDKHDLGFVLNRDVYSDSDTSPFDFAWNKYLQHLSITDDEMFNFISAICFSNIIKQAIFYTEESKNDDFKDLCVYLDSPLVFSLLGMDDKERVASVRFLIGEMKKLGCQVLALDHNLSEVKGIITNAGNWATSANYDISKANNAARYFHDNGYDIQDVIEYLADIEKTLSEYGVTKKTTSYDLHENQFQEDETKLLEMIKEKYTESGYQVPPEKEYSIKVDIQSIIMLYRIRQGVTSQTIQSSKHIMITQNGAIANVCKQYESNQSINAGHIPVCISADLFGTLLWMHQPVKMLEYHRKQLLADCYSVLKPSKKMLEKYIGSLNSAKNAGEIDEKKYLFMRSHQIVSDALMNITKGDYARFNDRTYLEVYDEIVATSNKKYADEANAHEETKKNLERQEGELEIAKARILQLEAQEQESFDKACRQMGIFLTIVVFGIPYIVFLAASQILISLLVGFSLPALFGIGGVLFAGIILDTLLKKVVYTFVSNKVRKYKEKRRITK